MTRAPGAGTSGPMSQLRRLPPKNDVIAFMASDDRPLHPREIA